MDGGWSTSAEYEEFLDAVAFFCTSNVCIVLNYVEVTFLSLKAVF